MRKTLIIAEAGVNHNGDIQLAHQLIEMAAQAGADIVKFQTFDATKIISRHAQKAAYQIQNTGNNTESQLDMVRKLQLSDSQHAQLIAHCNQQGIEFMSTPFDLDSVSLLQKLNMKRFKIPSGEITHLPLLRKIGALGKPVILSTGMATMDEIAQAIQVLQQAGLPPNQLTLLHCNTEYPTPFTDVNLHAMHTLHQVFGVPVGYSDHTLGIEVAIAAVALGAVCIEKHITLDRNLPGPDHLASLEPSELQTMIQAIRNIEQALGNYWKQPTPSEQKNIPIARKSIVAAEPIAPGELFTEKNIIAKRPANGINPMLWDTVIGKTAKRHFEPDEPIEL